MRWARLKEVSGARFRSFHDPFKVTFPEAGLCLISGKNRDTADSSASGKSSLVLAISYLFGGCPYPGTELQSWEAEEPFCVGGVLETPEGDLVVERGPGGLVVKGAGQPPRGARGKAAEAALDRVFGLDKDLRALATYRGQGQDGLFLSLSDGDKKEYLAKVLGLGRYERVAAEAAERAKALRDRVLAAEGRVRACEGALQAAEAALLEVSLPTERPEDLEAEAAMHDQAAAELRRDVAVAKKRATAAEQAVVEAGKAESERLWGAVRAATAADDFVTPPDLEAELDKTETRLNKVLRHDAQRRTDLDARRADIRARGGVAATKAKRVKDLQARLAATLQACDHLRAETCPTCRQAWQSMASAATLDQYEHEGAKLNAELVEAEAAAAEVEQLKAELAALPEFAPHPFVAQLETRKAELAEEIATLRRAFRAQHQAAIQAAQDAVNTHERAAHAKAQKVRTEHAEAVTQLEAAVRREEIAAAAARAEVSKLRARAAVVTEREQAVGRAAKALNEAQAAAAEVQRAANLELDVQALTGREGFLGVIVDDVLAEIADTTNALLARVANVRHVTFGFDPDPASKRITPVVMVNGEARAFRSGLSGGMQSAVKLAVDLAVGEVAAKRRGSYPGWLVLDESFDGLGRVAKETCLDMLGAAAGDRLILVIDHSADFKGLFQQVIAVESVDGRSRIV